MSELQKAIEAIKAGDKTTGQKILTQFVQANPDNEIAWLWLAVAVEDPAQKKHYLQRVLTINPNNTTAKQGLAQLETDPNMPNEPSVEEIVPKPLLHNITPELKPSPSVKNDASITIQRTSQYSNSVRTVLIFIDGKQVGGIKDGEIIEIPVTPGEHEVVTKVDWCKSSPLHIQVEPGQNIKLVSGNHAAGSAAILTAVLVLIPDAYLYLKEADGIILDNKPKSSSLNEYIPKVITWGIGGPLIGIVIGFLFAAFVASFFSGSRLFGTAKSLGELTAYIIVGVTQGIFIGLSVGIVNAIRLKTTVGAVVGIVIGVMAAVLFGMIFTSAPIGLLIGVTVGITIGLLFGKW